MPSKWTRQPLHEPPKQPNFPRRGNDLQALAAQCRDSLTFRVQVVQTYEHITELIAGGHALPSHADISAVQEVTQWFNTCHDDRDMKYNVAVRLRDAAHPLQRICDPRDPRPHLTSKRDDSDRSSDRDSIAST
eukprot:5161288-Pyramimonas_sp.AAC.1